MDKDGIADLIERVASWPEEAQAELVEAIIDIETKYTGVYRLGDDERAAVEPVEGGVEVGRLRALRQLGAQDVDGGAHLVDVRAASALADHQQMAVVRGAHVG